jgi:hypothetical protein
MKSVVLLHIAFGHKVFTGAPNWGTQDILKFIFCVDSSMALIGVFSTANLDAELATSVAHTPSSVPTKPAAAWITDGLRAI